MDFLFIVLGLVLLVAGGDWLLKSAVGISLKLKISKIIIGLTVVSFATSAPELIVSIKAGLAGFPDVALGNVVGSNIANIGLILGVVLIISKITVISSFFTTDWPAMLLTSCLLFFVLLFDGSISRVEGLVFFMSMILFTVYLVKSQKNTADFEDVVADEKQTNPLFIVVFLILGAAALWGGSELLVYGAVNVAKVFGVSDRIIAVTLVSVGTSIPELVASIMAAIKKENDISIGNIIGSNIFNILSVLGITAMIQPIAVKDQGLVNFDIYWMLGFAVILLPLVLLPKKGILDRPAGFLLLGAYFTFVYLTFN